MPNGTVEIPVALLQATVNYLATRPYQEVHQLIGELVHHGRQAQEAPAAEPEAES